MPAEIGYMRECVELCTALYAFEEKAIRYLSKCF